MWFCSSGFGPGPDVTPIAPWANGSAGPKVRAAKNADTTNITINAQPTSTSSLRVRNRQATAAVNTASVRAQSRIEPSSADHIAATLYSAGVSADPTCWTYAIEKSRVISARCIITTASTAPPNAIHAYVGP